MQEPSIRHFFVKIQQSFVHLVQYGHDESIVRPACASPSSSFASSSQEASFQQQNSSGASLDAGQPCPSPASLLLDTSGARKLIIFVPGNPGILGTYHDFLVTLYKTLSRPSDKRNNPVILAISHNNADHPDDFNFQVDERICVDESELSFVEKAKFDAYPNPHEVELQVMNKLIILKRLLKLDFKQAAGANDACKLVFLGHSIGCYVILRLLQDRSLARLHAGSILVHPALENLATTAKGAVVERYFAFKLDYVIRMAAFALQKTLPESARLGLGKWFCSRELVASSSRTVLESMTQLVCYNSLRALIEMAKSELLYVRDLDHETMIKPHANKLKLIYAINDHWVNGANRLQLGRLYPALHIEEQETPHAFIMDPDVVTNYAVKVGMFIQEMFD